MSETQPLELDPGTPEIDLSQVKHRSALGILALTSRTFLIQLISLAATFILTVYLDPAVYGVFFLVSSVVNFLAYFSDIGLAAALIQKRGALTREDLVTTFTIQQLLVLTLLLILFLLSPLIRSWYQISTPGLYLLYALGLSLFLSSLKTIPSVILERNIRFEKLIIPQIAETLVFNLTAVYLAVKGFGLTTFTVAVLARGITGLIIMYLISPWQIGLGISRNAFTSLLKFGLPYQLNTFLAMVKDDGLTIFLGKVIGPIGLGYIGWASRWANMPLRLFLDNVTKVAFPAFSRLQHDRTRLKNMVEVSLKYLALFIFPLLTGMAVLALPTVNLIPRYAKWLPALVPLYLYLINAAFASVSTLLTNLLSAVGRIKTTFKLMVMWTGLTWMLMPVLAINFGYLGVSIGAAVIAFSSIAVFIIAKRLVGLSLLASLKTPIIVSIALGLFLLLSRSLIDSLTSLSFIILGGASVSGLFLYLLEGKSFFANLLNYFKAKNA
ncbi:oligosaccharide flippase family protein [Candidatus Collierbacteria bacterium]|nr:oligosaccharide flippase family protein [Candidatus Collierbacteria bacterium]